jgi:hypothetical protein
MNCSSLCHKKESCAITEEGSCDFLKKNGYAVFVTFNERGIWSKGYAYLSENELEKDTIVIVPANNFYSFGKVIKSVKNHSFIDGFKYKKIIKVLNL